MHHMYIYFEYLIEIWKWILIPLIESKPQSKFGERGERYNNIIYIYSVRKNTIKIRFRSDEVNLTPFC